MILQLTCQYCKNEFTCEPYLSEPRIIRGDAPLSLTQWDTAIVKAKTICPKCGDVIVEICSSDIYPDDIIKLATCRYRRGD
jgi:hypothetical protein